MARVSEVFNLNRTQATLDFVDVETEGDTRLFIDPRAIERLDTPWGEWCLGLLRDFFERLLAAVKEGRRDDALQMLSGLGEPNQTHLGLSKRAARGSGIGPQMGEEMYDRLASSQAAKTGLLEHLEDAALLIERVSIDRISDIATNIIREPLLAYTEQQCLLHGIPREMVGTGPIWDADTGMWQPEEYGFLPTTSTGSLLLVPKIIVRRRLDLDVDEYYSKYILSHFAGLEYANPATTLVRTLKSGKRKVKMTQLRERVIDNHGSKKGAIIAATNANPDLLRAYRRDKGKNPDLQRKPLDLDEFVSAVNWDDLLAAVLACKPGREDATKFHHAVEALLTALFYPALTNPKIEQEIDQGRKRVDIRYTVSGEGSGFIPWVRKDHHPMPFVYVECKNYSDDLGNAELDQLTGRFNIDKGGRFGFLVNRAFDDKDKFIERCRDTAMKGRGFVLPLDDADLTKLTEAARDGDTAAAFAFLTGRFGKLVE